jgi:hypothetical protein
VLSAENCPPVDVNLQRFLSCILIVLCLFEPCVAKEVKSVAGAETVEETWSVPGILGGGVKGNDAYVDGSFFLTVPIYSTIGQDGRLAGDVLFIEPYTSWGEEGEVAMSLGVGWRHMFSDQSVSAVTKHDVHQAKFFEEGAFIGANLFVDMLDTQFDNRFWQLGFGIEVGTRYVEMRANYYVPLSGRELAEEIRTRERFTSQRRSIRQEVTYDEPFATGHTIAQDATFRTFETTVTRTTTIDRITRLFEEGMEGFDVELGLLVPGLDRWMDVKLIGGYYSFDNQPFGPQTGGTGKVEGWKAGLEVRPVPAVVLNGTWYEDDRLTGSDWTAGVRLEIPFEAGDLGDGKGLWDRVGDAFRPRRRHLVERMTEPVRRQNAAIKTSNSVEEESKQTTTVKVATKVVSQSKQRIVLADTVVFVDNAIGQATNPGTYEAPLDTVTNGISLGNTIFGTNAIVLVQGRPASYVESVTITDGVRLFGSGGFPGFGGHFFHGRTRMMPLVSGGFIAQNVPGRIEITGFDISGGLVSDVQTTVGAVAGGYGIFFENVGQAIIERNHLHGLIGGAGIFVEVNTGHATDVRITDNLIHSNDGGIGMIVSGSSLTAQVVGNSIINNGSGGMGVTLMGGSSGSLFMASNVISGNGFNVGAGPGLALAADGPTTFFVTLSGNVISFNDGDQMSAHVFNGATLNFIGAGTEQNFLTEFPGDTHRLYDVSMGIGTGFRNGFIFINGTLHPANLDLP